MKPSFHWLWFCGICYAINIDVTHASTTELTCSCGKVAIPPQTCAVVCGTGTGGGTGLVPGGDIDIGQVAQGVTCPNKYVLQSDNITYTIYNPQSKTATSLALCKYDTSVANGYACVAGYYRGELQDRTGVCMKCPSDDYNHSGISDDKNISITGCYLPSDMLFQDNLGNKYKYIENCKYVVS